MKYTALKGTLNPTHSLTLTVFKSNERWCSCGSYENSHRCSLSCLCGGRRNLSLTR